MSAVVPSSLACSRAASITKGWAEHTEVMPGGLCSGRASPRATKKVSFRPRPCRFPAELIGRPARTKDHREREVAGVVRVEVTGDGEFDCEALGPDQFGQGVHFGDDEHSPRRRYV